MWSIYAERGYARHMYYLTPPELVGAFELNTISRSLCVLSIGFGKMLVAFLIERIAPPGSKRKWLLRGISSSIVITGFITFVLFYAQCRPVQEVWDKSLIVKGLGSCLDPKAINTWNMVIASYWSFLDFALAVIPIHMVWKLQMAKKKKVLLCGLLGLGVFAGICAAVKTSKVPITIKGKRDLTWQTIELLMWGATEMNVVIIAACIPTLRPLYLIIFKQPGAEYYVGGSRQRQQASYAKGNDYGNSRLNIKSNTRTSNIGGKMVADDKRSMLVQDSIYVESRELRSSERETEEELQRRRRGDDMQMTDMGRNTDNEIGRSTKGGV